MIKERLAAIRKQMSEQGIDAYIIPSADPHISEYVPEHYKCLKYASGFTGSAGTLVITQDFAGLWTDFRYFEQAAEQLENSGYELVKLKVQHAPEYIQWLEHILPNNAVIGFDDWLLSALLGNQLKAELAGKNFKYKYTDLLGTIWDDRPVLPSAPAYIIPDQQAGKSFADKLQMVRDVLSTHKAGMHLISSLDDIAWLFNIRGNDVNYNPVILSFVLISTYDVQLFVDQAKLSADDARLLTVSGVQILPYAAIENVMKGIPADATIWIDPKRNCYRLLKMMPDTVKVLYEISPTTRFKAIKNYTEIANIRNAMIKDGVAMVKFFKWIEENIGKIRITEISAEKKLQELREQQDTCVGLSFKTIGGYKEHGALPHYNAVPESDSELHAEGLFLVDSGGQYQYGTTDITRMIALGNNTDEEKTDYTLVLKALIEGTKTIYPKGTCGYQIDAICRRPLWDHLINYGHGTGHGVGYLLNVHEGPQVINPGNTSVALEPGMITSIEPGVYRPGKHGIRIENLVLTTTYKASEFGEFLAFETLTLAPIETSLIKPELLDEKHIAWLNDYHTIVYHKLSPELDTEEKLWLKDKTKPFNIG
ncbi:MAG: aminopeptidase P family protein [Mucilaginibacter sp.]